MTKTIDFVNSHIRILILSVTVKGFPDIKVFLSLQPIQGGRAAITDASSITRKKALLENFGQWVLDFRVIIHSGGFLGSLQTGHC
jgi:hypothetical protein